MEIKKNKVVLMDYELLDEEGELLDESEEGGLAFICGSQELIPALENAMIGKKKGDEFSVVIEPENAYGLWDEELEKTFPIDVIDDVEQLEEGMQLETEDEDGEPMIVTVTSFNDKEVTLDANHPLAGMTLDFRVKILDVRDATVEEIRHGHVHGAGGHHH